MQLAHSLESALPGIASSPSEQDDTQLVQASQQGDQDAFAFLVQRHQRRLFTMSLRMLQDDKEASEITQEAFLAAWRGCHHSEARHALLPGSIASPTSVVCDSLNGASGRERGTRSCRRNRYQKG
jgi:Sigma-70 region 2